LRVVFPRTGGRWSRLLDADERTRKSYTADLIIVDVDRQIAYIVVIKRSLGSFESARIVELRQRMLAAALVAADLLWHDHKRLAVRDVRIVIIEAAGKRTDVDNGVRALDHLDHLLGVEGSAEMVRTVRQNFSRLAEANLEDALKQLARGLVALDAQAVDDPASTRARAGQGRPATMVWLSSGQPTFPTRSTRLCCVLAVSNITSRFPNQTGMPLRASLLTISEPNSGPCWQPSPMHRLTKSIPGRLQQPLIIQEQEHDVSDR